MQYNLKKIFLTVEFWRYADAYAPRVFGLFFHSLILYKYGATKYALSAWLLGILGIILSLVPDPHSYILIRVKDSKRILSLISPWLLFKVMVTFLICFFVFEIFCSKAVYIVHDNYIKLISVTIVYGCAEFLWSVVGTASVVINNVRQVAVFGVFSRLLSLTGIILLYFLDVRSMSLDFLVMTVPIGVAGLYFLSFHWRPKRLIIFFLYTLRKYTIWNQFIGLSTAVLFQMPTIFLGSFVGTSASFVGSFSFFSRLIQTLIQPLQILQSFVIAEAVAPRSDGVSVFRFMKFFMIGSFAIFVSGGFYAGYGFYSGLLGFSEFLLILSFSFGVAISCWHRFNLSCILATGDLRGLLLRGYIPSVVISYVAAFFLMRMFGLSGLSVSVFLGWILMSFSWKFVKG